MTNEEELKEAEMTMLMLIAINKPNKIHVLNIMCDNTNFSSIARGDDITLYFHKGILNPELIVGDTAQICFDYTNDPSPLMAGHCVSLGYYTLRVHVSKGVIKQTQPYLIVECKADDYKIKFTRPQRLLYSSDEENMLSKIMPYIEKRVQEVTASSIIKNVNTNN